MSDDIRQVVEKIKEFRDERDWKQYHNHKDMAISVVLEAAELLEHFQWKDRNEAEKHAADAKEEIEEEIADIMIYLLELADNLGIDIIKAAQNKIKKNAEKYPVEKAAGSNKKYTAL